MKVKLNKEVFDKYKIRYASYILFAADFDGKMLTEEEFSTTTNCNIFRLLYEDTHSTFKIVDSADDVLLQKYTYDQFKELFEVIEESTDENKDTHRIFIL